MNAKPRGGGMFSPQGFLLRALLLAVFFGIVHASGWREHTTFLSGTAVSTDTSLNVSMVCGLIYLLAYFGFVLLAPILILAAGILSGLSLLRKRGNCPPAC